MPRTMTPINPLKGGPASLSGERYESEDGWIMEREYGPTPNGNEFNGSWVLRDDKGEYVGHGRYRYDMEAQFDLNLK